MEQSARRLPDPAAQVRNDEVPNDDRRRRVRQKLHTPVYASFNGPQTGMVVDLSELIDIHEEGFAIQTSERLEINRAVTLCLDLPETRSFIHGTGEVIWSDDAGRGGIRFSPLSDSSRKVLKEWLFANLLISCSNHAARTGQLARRDQEQEQEKQLRKREVEGTAQEKLTEFAPFDESPVPMPAMPRSADVVSISDRSARFSSIDAVRAEVREIQSDTDGVFQLIAERALYLTGASGAALAFLTDDKMICRARAGETAPPIGAPVDVSRGLSGECIRTGLPVSCENTENDPRLDRDVGRALGVGSLMAAPIVSDFRVVGLLEIFSPHPHTFSSVHGTVLQQLVEMIPATSSEKAPVELPLPERPALRGATLVVQAAVTGDSVAGNATAGRDASFQVVESIPEPVQEPIPAVQSRFVYRALLGLVMAVVVLVLGYLFGPAIQKRWLVSPRATPPSSQHPAIKGEINAAEAAWNSRATGHSAPPIFLPELRKRADQGDPDAQFQMALRYHDGEDVPQDDTQAMQWFQRAAEQGQVDAQSLLGAYYWAGRGVPENLSKAYFWSVIATAQGDEISKARLEGLSYQMTREQVSAARQQAETWIHAHNQRARSEAN